MMMRARRSAALSGDWCTVIDADADADEGSVVCLVGGRGIREDGARGREVRSAERRALRHAIGVHITHATARAVRARTRRTIDGVDVIEALADAMARHVVRIDDAFADTDGGVRVRAVRTINHERRAVSNGAALVPAHVTQEIFKTQRTTLLAGDPEQIELVAAVVVPRVIALRSMRAQADVTTGCE